MNPDLRRVIAQAKKLGPDMTKPLYPGDYQPPDPGIAPARLVAYLEMGLHEEEFEGKKRDREKVDLVFELSGPNHEPRHQDRMIVPIRISVQETLTLEPASSFINLFRTMNYAGKATHMVELLGEAFMVEVFHRKSKDGKKVYANLKGPNGYNIKGTTVQDPLSGKSVVIEVAPAITELRAFVWKLANKAMWDSIHIAGEYA
jgi:hypothetical protein